MSHEPGVATIGLVLHPSRAVDRSIGTITDWARAHGSTVLVREADVTRIPPGVQAVPEAEFLARVDGVVALGGDGTMLGAMRLVIDRPVPVLGVNHGHLGFLVEVTPAGLEPALGRLSAGDFTVEQHGCLVAEAGRADGRHRPIGGARLDLPLRRDQLLELIPAELRQNAELSARRSASADPPG